MNSENYKQEELKDSLVIDKEGYICGHVDGFNIQPDSIVVRIYGYDVKKEENPDEEELVKRLISLSPKKGFRQRELGIEEFHDWVRETLNLSKQIPVTSEHLVKLADFKNIEIPKKTLESKVKIDKGSILWSNIDKIAFSDLGKCIHLKEILEAKNLGVAIRQKVDYRDTKDISGKMVIDSEAKMVGTATNFLVGAPPGILVNVESVTREKKPNIEELKKSLIPSRFNNVSQLFAKIRTDLHQTTVNDLNIAVWAMRNGIEVSNNIVEHRNVIMELPIRWEKISKIGDVVILSEPVEKLSRYY